MITKIETFDFTYSYYLHLILFIDFIGIMARIAHVLNYFNKYRLV